MVELLSSPTINQKSNSILWKLIDAIYPPFCCNCGSIGYEICPDCFNKIITYPTDNICPTCGSQLIDNNKCRNEKRHKDFHFDLARSWGIYSGPLKSALRKIKYDRGFGLIKHFANPIANYISDMNIDIDCIVPVALGKQREIERGYNQAEIIARPVARIINKPLLPHALSRIKETKSQVGLNYKQRKENVLNAFKAKRDLCNKKNILLFDDITTTFSTLNACAFALKLAGVKSVFCFTVARTIFQLEKEKK